MGLLEHLKDEYKDRLKQKHDSVRDEGGRQRTLKLMKKDCDKSEGLASHHSGWPRPKELDINVRVVYFGW